MSTNSPARPAGPNRIDPSDRLIAVNDLKTTGVTVGTVSDALRGKPGEFRRLHLVRDKKSFETKAGIVRILEHRMKGRAGFPSQPGD